MPLPVLYEGWPDVPGGDNHTSWRNLLRQTIAGTSACYEGNCVPRCDGAPVGLGLGPRELVERMQKDHNITLGVIPAEVFHRALEQTIVVLVPRPCGPALPRFQEDEIKYIRESILEVSYFEAPILVCTAPASRWCIHDDRFDVDAAAVRKQFAKTVLPSGQELPIGRASPLSASIRLSFTTAIPLVCTSWLVPWIATSFVARPSRTSLFFVVIGWKE